MAAPLMRKRSSLEGVAVRAYGNGGLEEFKSNLDDSEVSYGVVKMTFGSGSFARPKNIFVHFNGANCGAVKRGRANAKLPRAEGELKPTHASIKVETVEEVTEEYFRQELSSKFMDDSHLASMTTFTIGAKVEYHKAAIEAETKKAEGPVRRTATEMGGNDAVRCAEMVRDIKGPFNWILVKPNPKTLTLHNAGGGSVEEMRNWLPDDEVLYGLVRMGFGTGRFRRTYWWLVHWTPDNVSAVKRGKANSCKGSMQERLSPVSLTITASHLDDITLPVVIANLKRTVVVEGRAQADGGGGGDAFSLESFEQALREEQAENCDFFGVPPDEEAAQETPVEQEVLSANAVLHKILSDNDPANWGIFSF